MFCNPPYGREVSKWVEKADYENGKNNVFVVMLIAARTDTKWFHEHIYNNPRAEIIFLQGRLKFGDCKTAAPFPSMLVIFNADNNLL